MLNLIHHATAGDLGTMNWTVIDMFIGCVSFLRIKEIYIMSSETSKTILGLLLNSMQGILQRHDEFYELSGNDLLRLRAILHLYDMVWQFENGYINASIGISDDSIELYASIDRSKQKESEKSESESS
jgi:hypothetical protein